MSPCCRRLFGTGVLVALLTAVGGAQVPPTDQKPARAVEELVRDLGAPAFAVREDAQRELWRRGRAAIPELQEAANGPNPEVARRARDVLDSFSWYVFPDTPPAVLAQVRRFQTGKPDQRKAAFAELLRLGPHGRGAAAAVLRKDLPADTRTPLAAHLTTLLRREVPLLLFEEKPTEAAELLALHALGSTPEGVGDYAAFQVLRDTLPAAIADAEAAPKSARDPAATQLLLAHLYRADRDWKKARAAATEVPRLPNQTSLVEMLMEEEGDWSGLLQTPPPGPLNLPDAMHLTFLRLAGRPKDFEAEVRRVRESVGSFPIEVQNTTYALLLNNRVAEAADLMKEKRQNLGLFAEVIIARMHYQDALDLIGQNDAVSAGERMEFDLRRARVLGLVGKRDEAVTLFNKVAESLRQPVLPNPGRGFEDFSWFQARRALLRSELRVGLRDLAAEHTALFVDEVPAEQYSDGGESVFEILFGADADAAETAFRLLRSRQPADTPAGETMKRVMHLFAGTAPQDVVEQAVRVLSREDPTERSPPGGVVNTVAERRRVSRLLALATIYRGAKRYSDAEAVLTVAAEIAADGPGPVGARSWVFGTSDAHRPWLELGELLHDRGRFRDAAARFEEGWKRFPDQPLLLFLSGKSMVQAGQSAEGQRRIELSHWVALGNERVRGRFLEELVRRGEAKAARRETDLLLRACWPRDTYFGNVMNQAARAAALNRDWLTAERCLQRSLLVLMKNPGLYYVDVASYLTVPHEMLVYRTRGLLADGKVDDAMAQARLCLEVTPGNVELVAGMVPELERLGRKREPDELFGLAWTAYLQVLKDFPDSPTARGSLAWLAAHCRRELDRAQVYAKEAVAAEPKQPTFREALAEVHFRKGDRAAALGVMTDLAREFPRNRLYQRQLQRYRSGDPGSPYPDREPD